MKKIYTVIAIAILSISSFAQNSSNLIIFSEDGLKFYVILNGIRQNEVAMTNVKISGLTQPYYGAKIVFEDPKQPVLEKKYLNVTDPETKAYLEVTYKIKRNNKLVNVLRYFSQVPITQSAPASASVPEVHYNTEPMPEIGTTVTTKQTTTTSGSNGSNGNVNIGVNMPGINMNVNVNDPNMVQGSTTTTTSYTTTTTTTTNGNTAVQPKVVGKPNTSNNTTTVNQGCGGAMPMSESSFNSAKQTISKQSFDDTKLTTAKQILKTNCLRAAQIKEIMLLFSFEATRLELAKLGYTKCVDVNNYFLLNDAFSFESSVTELNESMK
jgi:hypothetical protein